VIIKVIIITETKPQRLFKKKAKVGFSNIYQIQVKVCQLIIEPKNPTLHSLAIKCG
jgi:hypothetical protein